MFQYLVYIKGIILFYNYKFISGVSFTSDLERIIIGLVS